MSIIFFLVLQNSVFFVSFEDTCSFIKKVNLKTGEVETVVKSEQNITALTVSSKGLIVYRTNDDFVKLYDTKSDSWTTLETRWRAHEPQISRDGERIVFCLEDPTKRDQWDLCLYSFKRNQQQILNSGVELDRTPSFSSDGMTVFFSSGESEILELYSLSIATKEKKKCLAGKKGFYDFEPSVSPDGKKLIFSSNRVGDFDIWLYDLKKEMLERITEEKGFEGKPIWFSNHEIVYEANHPDHWGIWAINIISKVKKLLTPKGEKCRYPAIGY